jgi:hypothetical protein
LTFRDADVYDEVRTSFRIRKSGRASAFSREAEIFCTVKFRNDYSKFPKLPGDSDDDDDASFSHNGPADFDDDDDVSFSHNGPR